MISGVSAKFGSLLVLVFQLVKVGGKFSTGSHGGYLDLAGAPAREFRDVPYGALLKVEKADDDLFPRVQGGDQFFEQPGEELAVGIGGPP